MGDLLGIVIELAIAAFIIGFVALKLFEGWKRINEKNKAGGEKK